MKPPKRSFKALAIVCGAFFGSVYFANASWLAEPARGTPRVVAQRGVSQTYSLSEVTNDSCTARMIRPPSHSLIDNTIPSIEAAIAANADVVEIDIRMTRDHQFILLHDAGLECRTDGSGRVSEHCSATIRLEAATTKVRADCAATR